MTTASFKGSIIKNAVRLAVGDLHIDSHPVESQAILLRNLLRHGRGTAFGKHYRFDELLRSPLSELATAYSKAVPVFEYESMYANWWRQLAEERADDIVWPGKIRYLALTSGTTTGIRKVVPVSDDMIGSTRKASLAVMAQLPRMGISSDTLGRQLLVVGGSTQFTDLNGFKTGLFSGIVFNESPKWFGSMQRPERRVHFLTDWEKKTDYIAKNAARWDISVVSGFPSWMSLLLEKVLAFNHVNHVADIWPNLSLYLHGGMNINPYKTKMETLFGKTIPWIETYAASEGYLGNQVSLAQKTIRLLTNNNIYFEFIPYNNVFLDENGRLKPGYKTLTINEVEPEIDYVLVVTNNSGAWRLVVGDVLRFVTTDPPEITISGRTGACLNDGGALISQGDLDKAFSAVSATTGIGAHEFTVISEKNDSGIFQHYWYVETTVLPEAFAENIDILLKKINQVYARYRENGLIVLPVAKAVNPGAFYRFLQQHNRADGQSKFPRILRGEMAEQFMKMSGV